jgi:Pretoxin HINT domain
MQVLLRRSLIDETIPGSGAILGALNRFAYVMGNPETATDPSGHWGFGSIIKAVTNVVKAAAPAIAHAVQVAAPVVAAVADSALGISSIVNDAKTIFDPHASWSSRLLSVADLAMNVAMDVDTITGTGQAARAAYMGVKAGAKLAGKQAVKLMKGEAKHLAEKELENIGEKRGEGMVEKVIKCSLNSFAGDTQVATPEGSQPIATLKVGDKVLAVDGATGKVQAEPVQNVMINHDNNLLDVTLAADPNAMPSQATDTQNKEQEAATAAHGSQAPPTETIHTTTEHPFLTAELGWVNAQDLKPGEHVRRLDGSLGVVVAVTATPGQAVRYNLTVAQDHTFVVGQGQWVVHNKCLPTLNKDEILQKLRDPLEHGEQEFQATVKDAEDAAKEWVGKHPHVGSSNGEPASRFWNTFGNIRRQYRLDIGEAKPHINIERMVESGPGKYTWRRPGGLNLRIYLKDW